mgnify:FL=1
MDKNIVNGAMIELARREFWYYCRVMAPDFYKPEREYQKALCEAFQTFMEGDDRILVINVPPRFGKSRTAQMFTQWSLGKNKTLKVMTGSYNETLSTVFSKNVRNAIDEKKADANKIVYSDIFPDVKIKHGDGAMNLWSLEGGYNNYLATSPSGTATGFGCDLMILDDLIKSALEAHNEDLLEKHWEWFVNTMLSRLEEGGKIIIIMTRWATRDLAGRAMQFFKDEGWRCCQVMMPAQYPDGSMLCSDILSEESYQAKIRAMGEDIAKANYQQMPIDMKGRLYSSFKTYETLPNDKHGNSLFTVVKSYCDTADTGADYLCNIIYGVYHKEAYVLDVYYTKDGMEITEPETAKRLMRFGVNEADIESNNGGRGFARNVERELSQLGSNRAKINWFYQSKNKAARILSNSTWVMSHVYYPVNWKDRWPEYYDAMTSYQKEGRNKHDDAPDATTGIAEKADRPDLFSFK